MPHYQGGSERTSAQEGCILWKGVVAIQRTMRPMLPQMTASPAGDHTARSGDIQRPVLLLCLMTTRSARPLAPSQMRSVLSREVVSTRLDPAQPPVRPPQLIIAT